MNILWEPLRSDDHWWGLYEDGYLMAVIYWYGQYPPSAFEFHCSLTSESEYAIARVHVTPM